MSKERIDEVSAHMAASAFEGVMLLVDFYLHDKRGWKKDSINALNGKVRELCMDMQAGLLDMNDIAKVLKEELQLDLIRVEVI